MPFRAGRSPLEKPGHDSRTFRPWMDGKRCRGVLFLFGYFLFEHAKRKWLGRRQAHETALLLAIVRGQRPLSPDPSPAAGEGSQALRVRVSGPTRRSIPQ